MGVILTNFGILTLLINKSPVNQSWCKIQNNHKEFVIQGFWKLNYKQFQIFLPYHIIKSLFSPNKKITFHKYNSKCIGETVHAFLPNAKKKVSDFNMCVPLLVSDTATNRKHVIWNTL